MLECSKKHLHFSHILKNPLQMLQLLPSLSVSNALFSSCLYEAPLFGKGNLLRLCIIGQLLQACFGNVMSLTLIASVNKLQMQIKQALPPLFY